MKKFWAIVISGQSGVLNFLAREGRISESEIQEIEGIYYLLSEKFDRCSQYEEVEPLAKDIVFDLNSYLLLHLGRNSVLTLHPTIGLKNEEGAVVDRVHFGRATITVSASVFGKLSVIDKDGNERPPVRTVGEMVNSIAKLNKKSDSVVKRAFSFYQLMTWWSFYAVFEVIRYDCVKEKNNKKFRNYIKTRSWLNFDDLEDFMRFVNSYDMQGLESRHSIQDPKKMPNRSYTFEEGKQLIDQLLRGWLEEKALGV